MADFRTHITVAALSGGLMATTAMAASLVTPVQAASLTLAASIGGILPDIDLNNSRQSRFLFSGLGTILGFAVLFQFAKTLSIAELWLIWLAVYVLFRVVVWNAFHRFTIHRGVFHSLLANLFFALGTVVVMNKLLGEGAFFSWMLGGFVFAGAMVHLLLDEIYSVDFAGNRVKRSFGSAVKLLSTASPAASITMALFCVGLFLLTPSMQEYLDTFANVEYWDYLHQRLLPQNGWFGIDLAEVAQSLAPAEPNEGSMLK